MASLGDLTVKLKADSSGLTKGLTGAEKGLIAVGVAAAAAGVALAVAVGKKSIDKLATLGDEMDKMSLRTSISTRELSGFKFAAEQSGTSIAVMEKGLKTMSVLMLDASRGLKTATDTMGELSVSAEDLAGATQAERFRTFASAIGGIKDPAMQAALAVKVFGRAGMELLPLFKAGSDGFAKLVAESERLGGTVTTLQSKLGAELTDAFNRVTVASDGLWRLLGERLAPTLISILDNTAKSRAELGRMADQFDRMIESMGRGSLTMKLFNSLLGEGTNKVRMRARMMARVADAELVMQNLAARNQAAEAAAAAAAEKRAAETERLKGSLEKLETPTEKVLRKTAAFREELEGFAGLWDVNPLVAQFTEIESGFTRMSEKVQKELRILNGATEEQLAIEGFKAAGVGADKIAGLEKQVAEAGRLKAAKEAAEFAAEKAKELQAQADAIKVGLETPSDKIAKETERLKKLIRTGVLDKGIAEQHMEQFVKQFDDTLSAESPKQQERRLAGIQQRGSVEAFKTILSSINRKSPELMEAKKQTAELKKLTAAEKRKMNREAKIVLRAQEAVG